MTLSTTRALIGCAVLFAILWMRQERIALTSNQARRILVIGCSFASSNLGLVYGLTQLDAGLASVIMNTMPLFSVPVAWILIRERPSRRSLLGLVIGLVGVTIAAQIDTNTARGQLLAVLAILAAPFFWAVTNILIKRAQLELHPGVLVGWMVLVTSCIFAPVTLLVDNGMDVWHKLTLNWHWGIPFAVVYTGTGGLAIAFSVNAWLLQRSTVLFASTSAYLIPVFGTLGGMVLLGERISVNRMVGAGVVFVGVSVVLFGEAPRPAGIGDP